MNNKTKSKEPESIIKYFMVRDVKFVFGNSYLFEQVSRINKAIEDGRAIKVLTYHSCKSSNVNSANSI